MSLISRTHWKSSSISLIQLRRIWWNSNIQSAPTWLQRSKTSWWNCLDWHQGKLMFVWKSWPYLTITTRTIMIPTRTGRTRHSIQQRSRSNPRHLLVLPSPQINTNKKKSLKLRNRFKSYSRRWSAWRLRLTRVLRWKRQKNRRHYFNSSNKHWLPSKPRRSNRLNNQRLNLKFAKLALIQMLPWLWPKEMI